MSDDSAATERDRVEEGGSFADLLKQYDRSTAHRAGGDAGQLQGSVVSITEDAVYLDIGYKTEGVLPLSAFSPEGDRPKVGDTLAVSVKGRNEEGYYTLSKLKVERPRDWESLEEALATRSIVAGTVTGVVKGGLTVDVGARAFLPASRSGARDTAEMEALLGQQIEVRITSLDVADENVVVDRRSVLEEMDRSVRERRLGELKEGDVVSGTVRSLMSYGAFLDLGGLDGLLHVGEIAWTRVVKPEDVLTVGEVIDVKVVRIELATRRIALSRKQLLPHPWDGVAGRYVAGQHMTGAVTRVTDFGAFVELEPGVEGMVHVSEMSWAKKVRKAGDMVKAGDTVEAVILSIAVPERRIALGLKQALGDPWIEAAGRLTPGSVVEGPVTSLTKFGAFVQVAEGVEGMVHISEIAADKRLNHPQDVLRTGQRVRAKVIDLDREKRQLGLSIKQMVPTGLEDFLSEHGAGDVVIGRVIEVHGDTGEVELGEGIIAACRIAPSEVPAAASPDARLDLSALSSLLNARWKTGPPKTTAPESDSVHTGQVRRFRIVLIESQSKKIVVETI